MAFDFDENPTVAPSPLHLIDTHLNRLMEVVPVCVHQFAHGTLTIHDRPPVPGWRCLKCGFMASDDDLPHEGGLADE